MPTSITELTYRVGLISETLKRRPQLESAIAASGIDAAQLKQGHQLAHQAFELTSELEEAHGDHTAHEQARRSVIELESWHRTILSLFRRALPATPQGWETVTGADIDTEEYTWDVMMRVWRTLSVIRCNAPLWKTLSSKRRVDDDLVRCLTLLRKTTKLVHKLHRSEEAHALRDQLQDFLNAFALASTEALANQPVALGLLGIAPEGLAQPLGGAAYDVLRHQRAQSQAPSPIPAGPCPQWTPGAAGNRENYWEQQ